MTASRSKIATASERSTRRSGSPSALAARSNAPLSAVPSWQAPPVPVSEMQPAVPGFCDTFPSAHATGADGNSAASASSATA